MSVPDRNLDEREQQLDAIIAEYYRLDEAGAAPDQTEFVARYPKFQQELSEFFADLGMFQHSGRSGSEDPALEPTITAGTSQRRTLATGAVVRYFGAYEILEELGSGGMGVVYKARHARLRKLVALKMIRAGELATEFEVKMFQAEARAAAKLDHPGIVAVHEVGLHAGQHFYSMDYVAGGSLSKLHRDEPVAARRAAELVRQMAVAIHYAHGMGIVHRDLKPANVLLTTTGVPRITDFGLAKRMWADEDSVSVRVTETGQVLGTAGYMSPEQAEGKTKLVGEPADIYSLGAVLYALLTSRAPFIGESQADTIMQVIHREPVSPRVFNNSLSRDLETICLKCLNKERHERYGTAELLADDLQRFLEGKSVVARPLSSPVRIWRWCKRFPKSVGSVLLLLISLLLILLFHNDENSRINFSARELQGTIVLRPLRRLLEDVITTRRLKEDLAADNIGEPLALQNQLARIERDAKLLAEADSPRFLVSWFEEIRSTSRDLCKRELHASREESDRLCEDLISRIINAIRVVGDWSNLILEPDLDGYYLMDAVLLKLPEQQTMLAEHQLFMGRALADGQLDAQEEIDALRFSELWDRNVSEYARGMRISCRESNSQLESRIEPKVGEAVTAAANLTKSLRLIIARDDARPTIIEYDQIAKNSLRRSFDLWDHSIAELDGLVQARIDKFVHRKWSVITIVAVAWIVGVCLMFGFDVWKRFSPNASGVRNSSARS